MNSTKHIYLIPGMCADSKSYTNIKLPENYNCHYLEWQEPLHRKETIQSYAERFIKQIKHPNPILIGTSFGGMLAQEIANIIEVEKIILISSLKHHSELRPFFKTVKRFKIYHLFPFYFIGLIENITSFFSKKLKKANDLYKVYLPVRYPKYMKWAIYTFLHWEKDYITLDLTHIHGTKDDLLPSKYIKDFIEIEKGSHVMVLTKGKIISKMIQEQINL